MWENILYVVFGLVYAACIPFVMKEYNAHYHPTLSFAGKVFVATFMAIPWAVEKCAVKIWHIVVITSLVLIILCGKPKEDEDDEYYLG